jgi:hypothetical protein
VISVITITGIGDHLRLDQPIIFTGMRSWVQDGRRGSNRVGLWICQLDTYDHRVSDPS